MFVLLSIHSYVNKQSEVKFPKYNVKCRNYNQGVSSWHASILIEIHLIICDTGLSGIHVKWHFEILSAKSVFKKINFKMEKKMFVCYICFLDNTKNIRNDKKLELMIFLGWCNVISQIHLDGSYFHNCQLVEGEITNWTENKTQTHSPCLLPSCHGFHWYKNTKKVEKTSMEY